jgi:hypothetical protein
MAGADVDHDERGGGALTSRILATRPRTREARDALELARVRSLPLVRPTPPPARPVDSYGIDLVSCELGPRDRLTLKACQARFKLANRPAGKTDSARTAGLESDYRASHCRGCATGSTRCGRKLKPPKPVVDRSRACVAKLDDGTVRVFDPDREQNTACPQCSARRKAREGAGDARRRVWGGA